MAKVEAIKQKVIVETDKIVSVKLELTLEEAVTLKLILRSIGGNPITSLRKYVDNMVDELAELDMPELDEKKYIVNNACLTMSDYTVSYLATELQGNS